MTLYFLPLCACRNHFNMVYMMANEFVQVTNLKLKADGNLKIFKDKILDIKKRAKCMGHRPNHENSSLQPIDMKLEELIKVIKSILVTTSSTEIEQKAAFVPMFSLLQSKLQPLCEENEYLQKERDTSYTGLAPVPGGQVRARHSYTFSNLCRIPAAAPTQILSHSLYTCIF